MDRLSVKQRSLVMSRVKQRGTKPELIVRSLLHRMGKRFRLQTPKLPGRPDIIFGKQRKVIFVNGCFWHGHTCSRGARPSSNIEFWNAKITKNVQRDQRVQRELGLMEWRFLVLWECELKDLRLLKRRLEKFLNGPKSRNSATWIDLACIA